MSYRDAQNRRKPRITVVGPSWPFRSGIAQHTTWLAKRLRERDLLAGFHVPYRQYPRFLFPGSTDRDETVCDRLDVSDPCYSPWEPWSWSKLLKRIVTQSPDAVVMPYWTMAQAPFHRFLSRRISVTTIVHNLEDHDGWSRRLGRWQRSPLEESESLFCHSAATRSALEQRFPTRAVSHHPLVSHREPILGDRKAARTSFRIGDDELAVLFSGIIRPYKGVELLLEAVGRLPREAPIVLLVAGEPWNPDEKAMRRRIRELGIESKVRCRLEWIPEGEIAQWFTAADVVALPYRASEGSGVASHARRLGIPMIATRSRGFEELIEDGVNGLLIRSGDVEQLRRAIESFLNPKTHARFSEESRRRAEIATWEGYVDALVSLIDRSF